MSQEDLTKRIWALVKAINQTLDPDVDGYVEGWPENQCHLQRAIDEATRDLPKP